MERKIIKYDGIYISGKKRNDKLNNNVSINGPHVYAYYENILGKQIVLFGEAHNHLNYPCKKLTDYIKNLTVSCIDYFQEGFVGGLGEREPNYFDESLTPKRYRELLPIHRFGATSFRLSYEIYKYKNKNLRVHGIDPRSADYLKPSNFFDYLHHISEENLDIIVNDIDIDYNRLIDNLITGDNFDEYFNIIGKFKEHELFKIYPFERWSYHTFEMSSNIEEQKKWAKDYSQLISKRYEKLNFISKQEFIETFKDAFYEMNKKIDGELLLNISMIPMDVYMLLRLFTKFKSGYNKCGDEIKKVIIYTGAHHTYFYIKFFHILTGLMPDELSDNSFMGCLEVPKNPFK